MATADVEQSTGVGAPERRRPAGPHGDPVKLKTEEPTLKTEEPTATRKTETEGSRDGPSTPELCLPTKRGTGLSSIVSAVFMFVGLLTFGVAELGSPNAPDSLVPLLWRFVAAAFLFYVPVILIAATVDKKYMFWGLQPFDLNLEPAETRRSWYRQIFYRILVCSLEHVVGILILAALVVVPVHGNYLGLVPIFGFGYVLWAPVAVLSALLSGRHILSKGYVLSVYPWIGFLPALEVMLLAAGYFPLRQLSGPWTGVFMPLLLSAYEYLGTVLLTQKFTKNFLTNSDVREAYAGTNQGFLVSMGICSLHAQAEGCRFVLLYVEYNNDLSLSVLIPIISAIVCNVLMRIGFMDRCLYTFTWGRWKPNNSSKLLRESGYCMGYPRFGAVGALILTKLCIGVRGATGTALVKLALIALGAEVIEDLVSFTLWRANVNVCPAARFATDEEVEDKTQQVLHRRSEGRSGRRSSFKVAASPSTSRDPEIMPRSFTPLPTLRWKVRVAHDFKYGPQDFGRLPFWAHLTPTMLAQF